MIMSVRLSVGRLVGRLVGRMDGGFRNRHGHVQLICRRDDGINQGRGIEDVREGAGHGDVSAYNNINKTLANQKKILSNSSSLELSLFKYYPKKSTLISVYTKTFLCVCFIFVNL